jgi:glycosidase
VDRHLRLEQVSRHAGADRRDLSAQHRRAGQACTGRRDKPEFQLPMDTQVGFINKLDVAAFRAKLNDVETQIGGNTPLLVFDNHDNPRLDARYGDGVHDTDIQRVISTMLFASRGAALFYYGDEIGMKTTPPTRKEDVKDPVGHDRLAQGQRPRRRAHADAVGRERERRLYQGRGEPWLPVPPSAATINVKPRRRRSQLAAGAVPGRSPLRSTHSESRLPGANPGGSLSDNLSRKCLIKKNQRRSLERCRRFCSCKFPQNPQGSTTGNL